MLSSIEIQKVIQQVGYEPSSIHIFVSKSNLCGFHGNLEVMAMSISSVENIQFKLMMRFYLGGLSRATHPNFPFLKSLNTRKAAWLTSPPNNCKATLSRYLCKILLLVNKIRTGIN